MKHRVTLYWRALSELETHWDLVRILTEQQPFVFQVLLDSPPPKNRIPHETVVVPVREWWNFHPAVSVFSGWRKPLHNWQPDVVLGLDEPYCFRTYQLCRWARKNGVPFFFLSCQNIDRPVPWPFSMFERVVCRYSKGAWFLNEDACERSRKRGFRGKGAVIPLGVSLAEFSVGHLDRSHSVANRARFTVGYVGRLVKEKGIEDLISACAGLEGIRLVIVGEGSHRRSLENFAREKGVAVEWKGRVPSSKLLNLYREMDVLVLPSRTTLTWKEQFGRVLIEAMAAGVPVIGSDSGEIPKVIGGVGDIFHEGDVVRLRSILRHVGEDPDLRRSRVLMGRRRVEERFTWEKVAESLGTLVHDGIGADSRSERE